MFTGAHDKLVDKRVFTTLKVAVLVKALHKLFVEA